MSINLDEQVQLNWIKLNFSWKIEFLFQFIFWQKYNVLKRIMSTQMKIDIAAELVKLKTYNLNFTKIPFPISLTFLYCFNTLFFFLFFFQRNPFCKDHKAQKALKINNVLRILLRLVFRIMLRLVFSHSKFS